MIDVVHTSGANGFAELSAIEAPDSARLIAAPDCGLGLLGRDLARAKLRHLCEAAHAV